MDLVVDDSEAGVKFLGRPGLIATGPFQGLDDQLAFKIFHGTGQGKGLLGIDAFRGL